MNNQLTKHILRLIEKLRLRSQVKLLHGSQLFDEQWYIAQYPDVAASGVNPLMHFLISGAQEGRDPHPLFDINWYLEQYPEVARAGVNPIIHYIQMGAARGYDPNPLFDTDWYYASYKDVDRSINALTHYLSIGAAKNYDPSSFFSTKDYADAYPDLIRSKISPLAHYLRRGTKWLEKLFPQIGEPIIPTLSARAGVSTTKPKILFIGHDASPTGAPVLLLNIIRCLKNSFGIEATVILLTGGALEADYRQLATVYIIDEDYKAHKDYKRFMQIVLNLRKEGYTSAFCNTAATGKCVEILYRAGFIIVSAVHEMQSVIEAMNLEEECKVINQYAHKVIFAAQRVRSDFEQLTNRLQARAVIYPQGLLAMPSLVPNAKEKVCQLLDIPADSILVLAVGLGDLRKGLDLYLQLARHLGKQDSRFHFIWVGNIAVSMSPWFKHDMDTEILQRCFHHVPFTRELGLYYQSADVFVLPSREDPFPSVVIDALAYGSPVVAFDKCGGYIDLLANTQNGRLVPFGDIESMADAIKQIVDDKSMHTLEAKNKRSKRIIEQFNFKQYAGAILRLLDPAYDQISESATSATPCLTRPT